MLDSATYEENAGFVVYQEVLPGFGRLMAQGAVAGALSSFLCVFFKVIIFPHSYFDGWLLALLLALLIYGAFAGLINAVVLWVATHVIERRLGRTARLMVTSVVGISFYYVCSLLFCLVLLINAPWLCRLMLYPNEPPLIKIIISGYLLLWCAFLLTRCRTLDPLFSSIREELRYYCITD